MLPDSTEATPQQPAGGSEPPTSTPSGTVEPNPLLEKVNGLESLIQKQGELIKSLQSGNDKRIAKLDTDIKRVLELSGRGLDESQIERELFIDRMLQGQSAPQPVQSTGSGQPQGQTLDVETTLKSLQFSENDPSLAALRVKYAGKPQELLNAAAELRLSQVSTPNPSAATGLSPTGQTGGGITQEQADAKLLQLVDLSRNYTKNKSQIEQLTKELKAAGFVS